MTGPMYGGGNFPTTFRTHDPLSYVDPNMSQAPNGLNLPMPHQMMMPMPFMTGPPAYNPMMNGRSSIREKKQRVCFVLFSDRRGGRGGGGIGGRGKNLSKPPRFSKNNATQSQVFSRLKSLSNRPYLCFVLRTIRASHKVVRSANRIRTRNQVSCPNKPTVFHSKTFPNR